VLGPALLVVLVTGVYATLGLLANAGAVAGPLSVVRALQEAGRMAVGLGSGLGLEGRFGRFFPASVAAVFYFGGLVVAARVLAPALVRPGRDPGLARAVSGDSLAYFALRDDRVSVRGGDSLVSWAPVGVVALAAGDPLGPPAHWPAAVAAFLGQATVQGRIAAALGCGALGAHAYRAAGLACIYLGDEAVLDLERFSLEGRAVRIARQMGVVPADAAVPGRDPIPLQQEVRRGLAAPLPSHPGPRRPPDRSRGLPEGRRTAGARRMGLQPAQHQAGVAASPGRC
jgi:hypothetical protein